MSRRTIKARLGIADALQDEIIKTLESRSESMLLSFLNGASSHFEEVPESLEWLIDDITIKAYNKMGDEGSKSVSSDGFSVNYDDNVFSEYSDILKPYREQSGASSNVAILEWY